MLLTLGASWLVSVMATLFVLTCVFMMLVILIQKPKGGGLSGAFGGAGGSAQAAFGAKTGDLLTMITIGCFVAFLGLAIGLVYAIRAEVAPPQTKVVDTTDTTAPASGSTGTSSTTSQDASPSTAAAEEATDSQASQPAAEVENESEMDVLGTPSDQSAPVEDTEPVTQP